MRLPINVRMGLVSEGTSSHMLDQGLHDSTGFHIEDHIGLLKDLFGWRPIEGA